MSNVLLVDTNFSSGPIYQYLTQAGHNVTVIGGNANDALAKSVDDYVQLDYSDVAKTRQLIIDRKINYLVPGCNDRSYMICAEINRDANFPGIDPLGTSEIINNKEKFREFCAKYNLPAPRMISLREVGKHWPLIVKPVDAFSGRGVTIVREEHRHELAAAIDNARRQSRTKSCILEHYVQGQLYSHTAFIQDGEVIDDNIVEEHSTVNPFVVDTSRVCFDFPSLTLEAIRKDIRFLAGKLNLQDGLIHTQFIKNGSQYWLIEITRRCPGDLYSQLIEISTGLNYVENYARPFLGLSFNMINNVQKNWVIRHTLTQSHEYTLGSLSFTLPVMIRKWVPIGQTGDRLGASPNGRIGVLFVECKNMVQFDNVWQAVLLRDLYKVLDR